MFPLNEAWWRLCDINNVHHSLFPLWSLPLESVLLPAPKPCAAKQVNPKNYGKDVFLPYEHAAPFAGLEWLRPSAGGIWDEGSLSGSKYWRSLMMGWATISHIYIYIHIYISIYRYTHSVDRGTHGNRSIIKTRRTSDDAPHPWWIYLSNHACRFQIQRHLTCTSFGQHLTIWQYPWNSLDLPNHLGISKNISQHSQLSWGVPGLRWPAWGFDGRKRPMKYIFTVDPRTRHRVAAWHRFQRWWRELGLNLDGTSRIWDDWYDDWLKPGYSWKVLNLQTPQNPPTWFESSRSSLKFYWQYCWNVSTWATPAFSKSCQLLHQSLDTIVPRSYGKQQFGFTVNSVQNGLDVLEVFGWRLHAVYICMHLCHPLWRELATESAEDIPLFQGPELTCFLRRYISYKENPEENLEPDTAASLMCSTCSKWHVRAEHGSWSPGRTTSVTVTGRNGGSTLTSTRTFSTRSAGSCSEVVLAYCIINQWNNCESDGRTKMVKTHKKKQTD